MTSSTRGSLKKLLDAIKGQLPKALPAEMTSSSEGSDLYEAYIFSLVTQVARALGYDVSYENNFGHSASILQLRKGPGYIYPSSTKEIAHAKLSLDDRPSLELHTGVRVVGKSKVLHEADLLLISSKYASDCRREKKSPLGHKALLIVEAKYYSQPVGLGIAREILGLRQDVSAKSLALACTIASRHPLALLAHANVENDIDLIPGRDGEKSFCAFIERILRKYKDLQ